MNRLVAYCTEYSFHEKRREVMNGMADHEAEQKSLPWLLWGTKLSAVVHLTHMADACRFSRTNQPSKHFVLSVLSG
jgi:hypothetical protein